MKRNQSMILIAGSIGVALLFTTASSAARLNGDAGRTRLARMEGDAARPERDATRPERDVTRPDHDDADDGVEIIRDSRELQDELRPRDIDTDIADTALVFTNLGGNPSRVKCVAYDGDGNAIGRAFLHLPALGLRYLLASDLADGADFIGHVQCGALNSVKGTAVFLGGGGITDLPSMQPQRRSGRIRFPLVATY